MKLTILSFFLLIEISAFAQTNIEITPIDISMIKDSVLLQNNYQVFIDSDKTVINNAVPENSWRTLPGFDHKKSIPNYWITHKIYLRFTLINTSDTTQKVFFIASNYVRHNEFFKVDSVGNLENLTDESKQHGFQPFQLNARQTETYMVSFYFTKKLYNLFTPQLVASTYLTRFQKFHYYRNDAQQPVGFLLSGVLLMMIFFTGANYLLGRKKEFLYNCCYSICMFGLIFLTTYFERRAGIFSSLFREHIDFMLLTIGTVFYIAFTRKFLNTETLYPLLNKIFIYEEKFLLIVAVAFTYLVFFTDNFFLQELLENGMKIISLLIGIVYIVIALSKKNKLMNYLAVGNLLLIFFSIISFIMIIFPTGGRSIFSGPMIYYEIGIVSELISFLLGLTYKNRVELIEKTKGQEALKREAEKRNFETKLAILRAQQEERNRISADMHDDLGAGVTAIRLYSELAKKRIVNDKIPEIDKISNSANELLNNMNAIIWTMSSKNDNLDNLVAYIRSYAMEYFETTGISCYTHVDENLPNIAVSGDVRRNIFLVVKEALNNILKHARATEVFISLKKIPGGLNFYIQDNGTGIDFGNIRRFGNGLKNMKKRMAERNILFTIENKEGTLITLTYMLINHVTPGAKKNT